jgi:hypothetical protein
MAQGVWAGWLPVLLGGRINVCRDEKMSRELKRVPMDFGWPLGEIWKGYLNPYHPHDCPACKGSGYNAETEEVSRSFYDFEGTGKRWCDSITDDEVAALIKANRLWDLTRDGKIPTAAEVNHWNKTRIGHDGINGMILVRTRAERLGVYGKCDLCDGSGDLWCDPKYAALYDAWEPIEPPTGEGFQLWEDVTEGSPVSPVFPSLNELATWAAEHATTFGSFKASKEKWTEMLSNDHVYHKEGNVVWM